MQLFTKVRHKWRQIKLFIKFVYTHFQDDDCMYRASALAFTSLLAIVPLMSVGLAILSAFPVFQDLREPVQDFIFENFVPATGKVIQNYVAQFTTQVSKLSVWGVAFLFVSALLVLVTIEQAMNRIWRVRTPRHGVTAFLLYWAILSFAPIILSLSLAASSFVFSLPLLKTDYTPSFIFNSLPFLLSTIGFTFLYTVVPNCHVKLRHAISGAVLAAVLFEVAKEGFAWYLTRYDTYQLLYGAFAIVPVFFIWIYYVWLITLIGAEVSYALAVHHQRRIGRPIDGFNQALLWLHGLWDAQHHGNSVNFEDLINLSQQPYSVEPHEMLKILQDLKVVQVNQDDEYVLSRNLNDVTLYDLIQHLPFRMPNIRELKYLNARRYPWVPLLIKENTALSERTQMSLAELFKQ